MKRIFCAALAALLLIFSLCGCGNNDDTSLADVLDSKKINIGVNPNGGAMSSKNSSGELCGFSVDCAQAWAKRLGITPTFIAVTEYEAREALNNGTIDCYWDYSGPSRELKAELLFEDYGGVHHQSVAVKSGSKITDLSGLNGKTVGVIADSYSYTALQNAGILYSDLGAVQQYDTMEQLTAALQGGEISAAVADDNEVRNYCMVNSIDSVKILESYISTDSFYLGFRRADNALALKAKAVMDELVADGTVKQISVEWFNGCDITQN